MAAILRRAKAPPLAPARALLPEQMPWALLLAASLGMFTAAASGNG